jgi:uncharacterized protein YodC (DUF2158 family)
MDENKTGPAAATFMGAISYCSDRGVPLMTVTNTEARTIDGTVWCGWFEQGDFRSSSFPEAALLLSRARP